jgi:hypothetical protein
MPQRSRSRQFGPSNSPSSDAPSPNEARAPHEALEFGTQPD